MGKEEKKEPENRWARLEERRGKNDRKRGIQFNIHSIPNKNFFDRCAIGVEAIFLFIKQRDAIFYAKI